jgi:hypothetical protein
MCGLIGNILSLLVLGAFAVVGILATPALAISGSQLRVERGTLSVHRSSTGPVFSLDRLSIGDTRTGAVTITNSGSLAGFYMLSGSLGDAEKLLRQLRLTIVDSGPRGSVTVYAGSLASLRPLELGRFGPGEARTFSFRLTFPSTGSDMGDNALQGLAASANFSWSAVQA